MVCGTPIIVPEAEGIMELLRGNGRCFAPGDAQGLARQLLQMANDELLYRSCVAAAELRREHFEGGRVAEQFEVLYRKLTAPADVDKIPAIKQDMVRR